MPTYQYHCTKCEHDFEFFHSMKDTPLAVCPKELCGMKRWGKGKVQKLIGAGAGLIFKGSGFYITDYRSQQYKDAAKKESAPAGGDAKPAGGSDTKPAGGSETKPATKTEAKPASKAAKADK